MRPQRQPSRSQPVCPDGPVGRRPDVTLRTRKARHDFLGEGQAPRVRRVPRRLDIFGTMKAGAVVAGLAAAPAGADITVRFVDASPDQITFTLAGICETGPAVLALDLTGSPAGLLIDMTGGVRRVEVIAGAQWVTSLPQPQHGDTSVTLEVSALVPGETIALSIDIDDTRSARPGIVRDWEIEGMAAQVTVAGATVTGTLDRRGLAVIPFSACLS